MTHTEAFKETTVFTGSFLVLNADPTHSIAAGITSAVIALASRIVFKWAENIIDRHFKKKSNKDVIREPNK